MTQVIVPEEVSENGTYRVSVIAEDEQGIAEYRLLNLPHDFAMEEGSEGVFLITVPPLQRSKHQRLVVQITDTLGAVTNESIYLNFKNTDLGISLIGAQNVLVDSTEKFAVIFDQIPEGVQIENIDWQVDSAFSDLSLIIDESKPSEALLKLPMAFSGESAELIADVELTGGEQYRVRHQIQGIVN